MENQGALKLAVAEILSWLRIQGRPQLQNLLQEVLSTANDRSVYGLTDGTRNGKQVAEQARVAKSTVSEKWKHWREVGILIETGDERKPRHIVSIEALGGLPE